MPKTEFHIVIIGSGNMAHALGNLFAKRHKIVQVVSRNAKTGKKLASKLKAHFSQNIKDISTQADFYFLCVPDDQIGPVSKQLKKVQGILVHHSGAQPLKALAGKQQKAVVYPFVSVNPEVKLNSDKTSIYYQASDAFTFSMTEQLFKGYKCWSCPITDAERLRLHLAGVLVNNFTNHLYEKAGLIIKDINGGRTALSFLGLQALTNLIEDQTHEKQTGPARRNDRSTLQKHLDLIKKDKELSKIYLSLSQSIRKTYSS